MKKLLLCGFGWLAGSLVLLCSCGVLAAKPARTEPLVLLEAEQFASLGGWVVDQQFMDQMGSPYLLAHGLGEPVRDAETKVQVPATGKYRVWVRTRDWVAPWKAPGAPGRFKVLVDKLYPNYKLNWAAYIAGKRESRRLLGDIVLTVDAFRTNQFFPDACFPCTWPIDLHTPDPTFVQGHAGAEFISQASSGKYQTPYWAPYRCLYSRNITNLFMAGRDISVTHEALGPVRVMRTCGCMGEVVGMAASLCKKHDCDPRAVYQQHLDELKQLMTRGVGKQTAITLP